MFLSFKALIIIHSKKMLINNIRNKTIIFLERNATAHNALIKRDLGVEE